MASPIERLDAGWILKAATELSTPTIDAKALAHEIAERLAAFRALERFAARRYQKNLTMPPGIRYTEHA